MFVYFFKEICDISIMNSNISARIKLYLDKNKLTAANVAEKIGCNSPEKISRLLRDDNKKPSYDLIYDIATNYNIDVDWLITGRENKRVCESQSNLYEEKVPLIPLDAMAGEFQGEKTILKQDCEFYKIPGVRNANFLITVNGMSMYPTYNSGDVVACKIVEMNDLFFQWNRVYVLDTNQGPIIKRVKPGSDNEHILIVSDNDSYEPFELHLSQIYHIALVLGCIKLE